MYQIMIFVFMILSLIDSASSEILDLDNNPYLLDFRERAAADGAKVSGLFQELNLSEEARSATIMTTFGIAEREHWPFLRFQDYVATVAATMGPERLISYTTESPKIFGIKIILSDKSEYDVFFRQELGVLTVQSAAVTTFGRTNDVTLDEARGIMLMIAGFHPAKLVSTLSAGGGIPADVPFNPFLSMFAGRWRSDVGGSCFVNGDDIGVNISEDVVVEYESSCKISDPKRDGYDIIANLKCGGEGEEWSGRLRMKDSDREHLSWIQMDKDGSNDFKLTRCF